MRSALAAHIARLPRTDASSAAGKEQASALVQTPEASPRFQGCHETSPPAFLTLVLFNRRARPVRARCACKETLLGGVSCRAYAVGARCVRRYHGFMNSGAMHNKSIDTDPQLQAAASPQVLVVRSFLR